METPYEITPGVHVLPSYVPLPSFGLVPVNAFLVEGPQPYLVDAGLLGESVEFLGTLASLIDLQRLRWLFLTHDDADHIGSVLPLLELAPQVKVVTNFAAMGKLGLWQKGLPPARARFLNHGEELHLGDRVMACLRPPLFDSPSTSAFHDRTLDALFSADAFGCPLDEPAAFAEDVDGEQLSDSQAKWASFDSPWIHHVDRAWFKRQLDEISRQDPRWILSAHLPPASRMASTLCANVWRSVDARPFVGPTQREFEALLAGLQPTPLTLA